MTKEENVSYCFLAEWYDEQAALVRSYHLYFFVADNSVELFDLKNRKTFLKRVKQPTLRLDDLYIGALVSIFARQFKIADFGDEYTRKRIAGAKSKTLALIKPDGYEQLGKILAAINDAGLNVTRLKMMLLSPEQAVGFYQLDSTRPGDSKDIIARATHLASGPIVALELLSESGVERWAALAGDSKQDSKLADDGGKRKSLRELFGTDRVRDAVHASASEAQAKRELEYIFDKTKAKSTASFQDCTVCVIKPHALAHAGRIMDTILEEGYEITAAELVSLDRQAAVDFLEVYKGVVPEYNSLVEQLSSGACIAMELRADKGVVESFRQLAGPADPVIGKHIRPGTLRARFGEDKVKNAIHCTDLPEDGVLESEFFFDILRA